MVPPRLPALAGFDRQVDCLGRQLRKALDEITPQIMVQVVDEMLVMQRGRELGYKLSDEQFASHMNGICMQCHSTFSATWVEKHDAFAEELRGFKQRCIDCHEEIHPLALSRRPAARKEASR